MKRLLLALGLIPTIVFSQNILFGEDFDNIIPNFQNPGSEVVSQTQLVNITNWQWNVPSPLGSSPLAGPPYGPGGDHCLFSEQGISLELSSPCISTRASTSIPYSLAQGENIILGDCTGHCNEDSYVYLPEIDLYPMSDLILEFDYKVVRNGSLIVEIKCDNSSWEVVDEIYSIPASIYDHVGFLNHWETDLSWYVNCSRVQIRFVAVGHLSYSFLDNIELHTSDNPFQTTNVNEIISSKNITKIVNINGQEVPPNTQGILIYIYSDGTTEKKFNTNNFN